MLDKRLFLREFGMLADRFSRTISEPVVRRYYEALRDRLTDAEFEAAARLVFDRDQFWPAPARFIEVAQGNAEEQAEREWRLLLNACARGDRNILLSPEGAEAMRAVGGWNAVAYCEGDRSLDIKRRAFLRHHEGAREERELLRLNAPRQAALEVGS